MVEIFGRLLALGIACIHIMAALLYHVRARLLALCELLLNWHLLPLEAISTCAVKLLLNLALTMHRLLVSTAAAQAKLLLARRHRPSLVRLLNFLMLMLKRC